MIMNDEITGTGILPEKLVRNKSKNFIIRTIIVVLELSLIIILLVLWLGSESIRESKNIWIFFFYNFPSQFLISFVPHEPVLFYYSKFYSVEYVTFVAITGTLITEMINYSVFGYFADLRSLEKFRNSKIINYLINLFNKMPFIALLIAGFTPVPFYPFRFLVVLANYPKMKYLLAVFLSRTPRFYLLALLGKSLDLTDSLIVAFFVIIAFLIYIPVIRNYRKKKLAEKIIE
jgi:membrane protein YqaA with SNARE-associated domain